MAEDATPWRRPLGAAPLEGGRTRFRVWAPRARIVAVAVGGAEVPLAHEGHGVFVAEAAAGPGEDYHLVIDGGARLPDPCSRFQPEGVLGPSRVVDPAAFRWSAGGWEGLDPQSLVIYELHVGTFTRQGTFAGVATRLGELRELGVTAIELMPVATFPGERNWGYDGLYTWAPHPAYGGPEGLAALVDAAHAQGLCVILDVVYNHLGPGAQALEAFGPYLADGLETPWGPALNLAGPGCGGAREWALQNACMWLRDYRIDGLRVDAVHTMEDPGPRHLAAELCARTAAERRTAITIAECGASDPRLVQGEDEGGWGFDAQWSDGFHHALHALLTGERDGYYAEVGSVADLAAASAGGPEPGAFVVYAQNHDQIGNRALGDRLPAPVRRLAAMWVLLSPFVPLVFMGEEHGERRPFQFFTDHIDPRIAEATRRGRRRELAAFAGFGGELPDPQDPATFARSVIDPDRGDPQVRALYRDLLALRRALPPDEPAVRFDEAQGWIGVRRGPLEVVGNFARRPAEVPVEAAEVVLATGAGVDIGGDRLRLPALHGAVVR
ncbi:MAG: alpha-amylase family glycosyl hydrolase [Acidimicrobiales bacterium]